MPSNECQHAERRAAAPSDPKPHIDVNSGIKTAIPTLDFSAISDAAMTQPEINKIRNKKIRMYHPWSSLTDGGLYEYCVVHLALCFARYVLVHCALFCCVIHHSAMSYCVLLWHG